MIHDIRKQIDDLQKEAMVVYSNLVLPNWGREFHGFPQTLYGYMMDIFSLVDLVSACWKGSRKDQTNRMTSFMSKYMIHEKEANTVAVHMWRHKLMHTAQPRPLRSNKTGKTYRWLLHWHEHLPKEQHYTFSDSSNTRILNIGLMYLIRDLKQAVEKYEKDLLVSAELQSKFTRFQKELGSSQI